MSGTVGDEAGSAAFRVESGGDTDNLDVRPTKEHCQRTGIIRVLPNVGVEMDQHERGPLPVVDLTEWLWSDSQSQSCNGTNCRILPKVCS
jgi:hypothetical protein